MTRFTLPLFFDNDVVNAMPLPENVHCWCLKTETSFALGDKLPKLTAEHKAKRVRGRKIKVNDHVFDSYAECLYTFKMFEYSKQRPGSWIMLQYEIKHESCKWIADILYVDPNNRQYAIDVKPKCKSTKVKDTRGKITDVSRLKIKLLSEHFGEYINISVGWLT